MLRVEQGLIPAVCGVQDLRLQPLRVLVAERRTSGARSPYQINLVNAGLKVLLHPKYIFTGQLKFQARSRRSGRLRCEAPSEFTSGLGNTLQPISKEKAYLDYPARLAWVRTRSAERVARRDAVCPHKRKVPTSKETLVLKSWC